jgi:hypothetical protein
LFSNGFGRRETKALIAGQTLQDICAEARRAVLQVEPVLVAHWFLFAGLIWPFRPVIEQQARTACSGLSLTRVITGLNFFVIGINQSPPRLRWENTRLLSGRERSCCCPCAAVARPGCAQLPTACTYYTFSSDDGAAGQDRLFRVEFDPCDHRLEFLCDWHKIEFPLYEKKLTSVTRTLNYWE